MVNLRASDHAPHPLKIQARPVIGHNHLQHPGAVPGFEADDGFGRFAGLPALLGKLAAVIHGVAEQVRDRGFEPGEDFAIHLRAFPNDFEVGLLAQRAGQVAHHARKAMYAVAKGAHPRAQHFEVKPVGEVGRPPIIQVQLQQTGVQIMLRLGDLLKQTADLLPRRLGEFFAIERLAQPFQGALQIRLHPLESLQGFREGSQPARFDERLPRQAQQAIEVLGGQVQNAITIFRFCGDRWFDLTGWCQRRPGRGSNGQRRGGAESGGATNV